MNLGLVAIVGAPNVGKSRLFNRLTKSHSIVHNRPGVTRDRIEAFCEWRGKRFRVLDTGGLVPGDPSELTREVQRQVLIGVEEASMLLFVVDGRSGLSSLDQVLASLFRKSGRRILLAVNKVDVEGQEVRLSDFYRLGFPEPVPISAEEGRGISVLLDRIVAGLPEGLEGPTREDGERVVSLAVVGRPNVGKSTLFNRLTGVERAVVTSVAGTTRDPVDMKFVHHGRHYRVVDTAGLRRKARADREDVELQSVSRALTVMKEADMVIAVLDATEPATHQDRAVIGEVGRTRRPLLVVLNKVDLLRRQVDPGDLVDETRAQLRFSADVPVVPLSALKGEGLARLLAVLARLGDECARKVSTPRLNEALETAIRRRSPGSRDKVPRLYYITQTGSYPPSFLVFTNGALIDASYRRYLSRHLKEALGFGLAPVALKFRKRP